MNEQVKNEAIETLAVIGLSVSDAVHVFLLRVIAEKQMPFALKVPNAETRSAMAEADELARTKRARYETSHELIHDLEETTFL
ncbi:MAG: type II toxin-antitoxin system RelB/DinJ family antitoxin [Leptospirales bacterium]